LKALESLKGSCSRTAAIRTAGVTTRLLSALAFFRHRVVKLNSHPVVK